MAQYWQPFWGQRWWGVARGSLGKHWRWEEQHIRRPWSKIKLGLKYTLEIPRDCVWHMLKPVEWWLSGILQFPLIPTGSGFCIVIAFLVHRKYKWHPHEEEFPCPGSTTPATPFLFYALNFSRALSWCSRPICRVTLCSSSPQIKGTKKGKNPLW